MTKRGEKTKRGVAQKRGFARAVALVGACVFLFLVLPSRVYDETAVGSARSGFQVSSDGGPSYWLNFFTFALDQSGLDVRDSKNRKVRSRFAQATLKQLFITAVYSSILSRDLHMISQVRMTLDRMVNPFSEKLARTRRGLLRTFEIALLFTPKRLSDFMKTFWCAVFLALISALLLHQRLSKFVPVNATTLPLNLPLRC